MAFTAPMLKLIVCILVSSSTPDPPQKQKQNKPRGKCWQDLSQTHTKTFIMVKKEKFWGPLKGFATVPINTQILITDSTAAVSLPSGKKFFWLFTGREIITQFVQISLCPRCSSLTNISPSGWSRSTANYCSTYPGYCTLNPFSVCLTATASASFVFRWQEIQINKTTQPRSDEQASVKTFYGTAIAHHMAWAWCPSCRFLGFNMVPKCFDKPGEQASSSTCGSPAVAKTRLWKEKIKK